MGTINQKLLNREREWLNACHGAIMRGGKDLSACLSDYRVTVPEPRHWASVGNFIVNAKLKSKVPGRQAMMSAWLEHPDRPPLSEDHANALLCYAVLSHQHQLIPMLHGAGVSFTHDSEGPRHIAKEMKMGRWPYPELIAPQITSFRNCHQDIADGVMSANALRSPKYAQRMALLPLDDILVKRISRLIARLHDQLERKDPKELGNAVSGFVELAMSGWIDMTKMASTLVEEGQDPQASRLFTSLERRVLERRSAQITTPSSRRAMRL